MKTIIILSGADRVGKSTMARQLESEDCRVVHHGPPPPDRPLFDDLRETQIFDGESIAILNNVLNVPLWVFKQVFGFVKHQFSHYERAYRGFKRILFTGNPTTFFGFWLTDFIWNVFKLPLILSVVFVIHCIYCNKFNKTLEAESYFDTAV